MTKVLYITHKPILPVLDGGSQAMFLFFDALTRCASLDITYSPMVTPRHKVFEQPSIDSTIKLVPLHIDTRIKCSHWKMTFSKTPLNVLRYTDEKAQNTLGKLIDSEGFDVVICDGFYALCLLSNTRSNCSKIIYRSHNIETNYWKNNAISDGWWKRPIHRWIAHKMKDFEKEKVALASHVLSISKDEITTLKQWNSSTQLFLPHVAPQAVVESSVFPKMSIGYVGDMSWLPNATAMKRFLKELWPEHRRKFPHAQLSIAGKGSERYTNASVGVLGHGFVQDLHGFIQQQRFLINPVIQGTGFNMKLLDALTFKKPVITFENRLDGLDALSCFVASGSDHDFLWQMERLTTSDKIIQDILSKIPAEIEVYLNVHDRVVQLENLLHGA
ncbi:MAG: glycosyltransferase [Bacteroidota bacterium]